MFGLLAKHTKLIVIWAVVFVVLINAVSLLVPLQYSATSQVLLISRDRTGVDPYTQAKSAERIGENLAQVMKTSDFFDKVLESQSVTFDKDIWKKLDERARRKKWQEDVKPEVVYNTSLLKITAYAGSQEEVVNLLNAITQTVTSRGWEYIGGDVALKQVDTPLVSRLPARPNFILNTLAGLMIGSTLSSLWILRYKKHHIL